MSNEEIFDERKSIQAKNRKLRTDINSCNSKIRQLYKRIEMERWDIQRLKNEINSNTEKFIELGKQLNHEQ